jgi:hypothetical protein
MKKLNKVVKPNWLSDISVQEVNIGTFPPLYVVHLHHSRLSLRAAFPNQCSKISGQTDQSHSKPTSDT